MKKTIISLLALSALSAHAAQLSTFTEIADAVSQGKKITFALDFKQCASEKSIGDIIASLTPDAIMVSGNKRIIFSNTHFTLSNFEDFGTPYVDYGKYSINSDGTSSVKLIKLHALSYEKISEYQFNCALNKGIKAFI